MTLRLEELPDGGIPLFHSPDLGHWASLGRLRNVRFCFVKCDDCNGNACMVFRSDFTKAMYNAGLYNAQEARRRDMQCQSSAVRIRWKNASVRTYLCYPHLGLMRYLKDREREQFKEELNELRLYHKRHGSLRDCTPLCLHDCPRSCCRMYSTASDWGHVAARRYGDERRIAGKIATAAIAHAPSTPPSSSSSRRRKRRKKEKSSHRKNGVKRRRRHHSPSYRKESKSKQQHGVSLEQRYEALRGMVMDLMLPEDRPRDERDRGYSGDD